MNILQILAFICSSIIIWVISFSRLHWVVRFAAIFYIVFAMRTFVLQ
jgi:hypothetical protein